jgi:uncharacterized cofD-like protein
MTTSGDPGAKENPAREPIAGAGGVQPMGPQGRGRAPAAHPAGVGPTKGPDAPRVVAFGGGTGMSSLLRGLRRHTEGISAIVTVTDNGGSSGLLRKEFEIVPPGDIRSCLIALADVDPVMVQAFEYRFTEGEFRGHCFGNLFITILTRMGGGFEESIQHLHRLLNVKGRVLPASRERASLVAHHPDSSKSTGEVQITKSGKRITKVELRPSQVFPADGVLDAIARADLFIFGPGSLFTSVIPNLLVDGVMDAINRTGKPRIYIGNMMTQKGETIGFRLSDHVRAIREHVGNEFPDVVIAHKGSFPPDVLQRYAEEGAEPVAMDLEGPEFRGVEVIASDFYTGGEPVRHDPAVLARLIHERFLTGIRPRKAEREPIALHHGS